MVIPFSCPVCSNNRFRLKHKVKNYDYYSCLNCKVSIIIPFPSESLAKSWYNIKDYYCNEDRNIGYDDYEAQKSGLQKTFDNRNRILPNLRYKDILEIGCGLGYYGEVLAARNVASYTGLDLNPYAIDALKQKGFNGIIGEIRDIPDNQIYDYIVFFDVLEHILSPNDFLHSLSCHLKKGGKILFTTPSTSSFLSRISGNKWVSYIIPQHILLYNEQCLNILLAKNGFRILKMRPDFQWVNINFFLSRLKDIFPVPDFLMQITDKSSQNNRVLIPVPNGNVLVLADKGN